MYAFYVHRLARRWRLVLRQGAPFPGETLAEHWEATRVRAAADTNPDVRAAIEERGYCLFALHGSLDELNNETVFRTYKRWLLRHGTTVEQVADLVRTEIVPHYRLLDPSVELELEVVDDAAAVIAIQVWRDKETFEATRRSAKYRDWYEQYKPTLARWDALVVLESEWAAERQVVDYRAHGPFDDRATYDHSMRTPLTVLVTAFEPFGGDAENASFEAAKRLPKIWREPDVVLHVERMPVAFARGVDELRDVVARHRPDAIVSVGENGTSAIVTVETVGRNQINARIPDNDGNQPQGEPVDATVGAPSERAPTVDVGDVVRRVRAEGVHAELSSDAGGFVCNAFAYVVPSFGVPAVFVHVPAQRTTGAPSVGRETNAQGSVTVSALSFDALALAVRAAAESTVATLRARA